MAERRRLNRRPFWIKLLNWEYWPTPAFYWPMLFIMPGLMLRARHFCFFSATNPGILAGGFGLESKFESIHRIPEAHRPRSILVQPEDQTLRIDEALEASGLHYPLIVKPDVGFRGFLVRKVYSPQELHEYLQRYHITFIVQEYLDYPKEFGVFYHRLPGAKKGDITSLTLKEFLHVVGDGHSTVYELIHQNERALLQLDRLQETHQKDFKRMPAKGEKVRLGAVGNHNKGTAFINGNPLIDDQLIETFDLLTASLDGFYFGRFDLKCESLEQLKKGKNFKVIEMNGVFSEPTHIYDQTRTSYWKALGEIIRHWLIAFRIAEANRRRGASYLPTKDFFQLVRELRAYQKSVKAAAAENYE